MVSFFFSTIGAPVGAVLSSRLFFSYLPPWYIAQHSSLFFLFMLPVSPGAGVGVGAAGVGLLRCAGTGKGVGAGAGGGTGVGVGVVGTGTGTGAGTGAIPGTTGGVTTTSLLPATATLLPSTPMTTLLNISSTFKCRLFVQDELLPVCCPLRTSGNLKGCCGGEWGVARGENSPCGKGMGIAGAV